MNERERIASATLCCVIFRASYPGDEGGGDGSMNEWILWINWIGLVMLVNILL
jgi:hypothetical protein